MKPPLRYNNGGNTIIVEPVVEAKTHPLKRGRLIFHMVENAQLFHNSGIIGQNNQGGAN
jgi:hypothetical protein